MKSKLFTALIVGLALLGATPLGAATFTPNVFDDPAPVAAPNGCIGQGSNPSRCSLREAVISANANADADEIVLSEGIYQLARSGADDTAENGDLDLTQPSSSVSVLGTGSDKTIIDAAIQGDRIFNITAISVTLSLNDMTLRNGNAGSGDGGAVGLSSGDMTLNVTNCRFEGNQALEGGAIEITNSSDGTFSNVVFSGNQTTGNLMQQGGGALRVGESSSLSWENGVVSGNQSAADGGGIYYSNSALITMTNIQVFDNEAAARGGGLFISSGPDVDFEQGLVVGNRAAEGGGFYINNGGGGEIHQLNRLTIADNEASGNGGGFWVGSGPDVLLDNSTVSTNTSGGDGGGFFSEFSPTLFINNSTISGNSAAGSGGAVSGETGATFDFRNATIFGNTAQSSAGGILSSSAGLTVTIANSILAGNTVNGAFSDCNGVAVGSGLIFTSGNYNLFGEIGDCAAVTLSNDQSGVNDPGLNALADNGGGTLTHLPNVDSPAIDGGNPGGCLSTEGVTLVQDQRGQIRPVGAACDVGSVELGNSDLSVTKTADANSVLVGDEVIYTITATNNGPNDNLQVTLSDSLPAGLTLVSASSTQGTCIISGADVNCSLEAIANGASATVEIVVTADDEGTIDNTATVSGSENDTNPDNNSSTASIDVSGGGNGGGGGCSIGVAQSLGSPLAWGAFGLALAGAVGFRRRAGARRLR